MSIALSQSRRTLIRALHRRKGRREEGAYLVEGERLVAELAGSGAHIRFLFGLPDRVESLAAAFPWQEVCSIEGKAEQLFATENAQGVGAVVEMPEPVPVEEAVAAMNEESLPLLYLDRMADPGNVGTIVRTADWFGLRYLLRSPGTADPFNPKAVRATMGAVYRVRFTPELEARDLVGLGVPLLALDAAGTRVLGDASLAQVAVYAVGSEAHGVDPVLKEHAQLLAIAGSDRGESLNAAVAAGILLHELHRSRISA